MKIITISREFGSGGRELGKRLSDLLGFDYYDNEIITAIAEEKDLDETYVRNTLETSGWQTVPLHFSHSFSPMFSYDASRIELLVAQKKVIEQIGKAGKDCIIVGRNADILLAEYEPLNLFVCAHTDAKIKRCTERAEAGEDLTEKALLRKIRSIDKARAQTRTFLSGSDWGGRHAYHLTINTTDWCIKELAPVIRDFAVSWFGRAK